MSYTTDTIAEFLPKQNDLKKLEKDLEILKNCHHEKTKFYYIIKVNGEKAYMELCSLCGERKDKAKVWIKASTIPNDATIIKYTDEIKKEFSDKKNILINEINKIKYAIDMSGKYQDYLKYLESPEWDEKRRMRLYFNKNNFHGKCEVCGKTEATQCHHMTYERLYNEWIFDLAAVCSSCHERIHNTNG